VQLVLIIFLVLLSVILWFLVAPLVITIDSIQGRYELRLVSIGFINLMIENENILLRFNILFFRKTIKIDPFKITATKQKTIEKKKKKKRNWMKMKDKIKRFFRSFKLEKLWLNVDTDSYYYNAFLYPVFYFIKGKNYHLNINYQGNNELCLVLKNRPIRILYALIF
jgi:hypothetical protein